jgi:hypothetical protein
MLDDTLSGLDTSTEEQVFHRLCGEKGIFRELNTTVLLVSSSGKCPLPGVDSGILMIPAFVVTDV